MSKTIICKEHEPREIYKLMISLIGPRPIGWISTVSTNGNYNLAPYSFFNMFSMNPAIIGFSASLNRKGEPKDSLRNAEATGCFVHNVVSKDLVEPMNSSSAEYEHGVSEFEKVGLSAIRSDLIEAPRVKEAAISCECKLKQIVSLGDQPGNGQLVLGEVLAIHIQREEVLADDGLVDEAKLKPIGRLGRVNYMDTGEIFSISRPKT